MKKVRKPRLTNRILGTLQTMLRMWNEPPGDLPSDEDVAAAQGWVTKMQEYRATPPVEVEPSQ